MRQEGLIMDMLIKIEQWILKIERVIMAIAAGLLVIAVLAQVFFRYILPISMPWTEELSIILFVFMVMYGAAYAIRYDRHLGIISLTSRMSEKNFKLFWFVKKFVIIAFVGYVMLIQAIPMVRQGLSHTYTIIQIPSFFVLVNIPISAGLMIFHTVMSILRKDYVKEYAVQKASIL